MKKISLGLLLFIFIFLNAQAQEDKKEFTPSGKILGKVFANFKYSVLEEKDEKKETAFELKKVYFGYKYSFLENCYGKILFDIDGDGKALVKKAYLNYNYKKLSFKFGLIGMKQFKTQEKIWGHRYIEKSLQDKNKMGNSADRGFILDYKFSDFISLDYSICNGEAYKTPQADEYYKNTIGINLKYKDFKFRVYGDYSDTSNVQTSLASFFGIEKEKILFGLEYNLQNNNNSEYGFTATAISTYLSYQVSKKIQLFSRLDYTELKKESEETKSKIYENDLDGTRIIAGVEYQLSKKIKYALNIQNFKHDDKNHSFIYFNVLFKI